VKRLTREVDSLRAQISAMGSAAPVVPPPSTPDNPAYIQLQARLSATDSDIASLRSQQASLKARLAELEDRITNSPEVERQYRMLSRDYEIAQAKYQEVLAKKQEAELASSLETKQRGERFTMIEPPVIPEEPSSPNRLAIGLLGMILSLACGVGGGALAENLDSRLYGRNGVMRVLGVPPLAVIPDMGGSARAAWSKGLVLKLALTAVVLVVLGAVVIHFTMGPLDVFFFRVLRFIGF
jgi:hypothetical protein